MHSSLAFFLYESWFPKQSPCHLSESKTYSRIHNQEIPSKGANSVTTWGSTETETRLPLEWLLRMSSWPWSIWIHTLCICLEQGMSVLCLVQRTIICCYCCCASWEITFVSLTGFWVVYWDLLNSRQVTLYSVCNNSSSKNTSKAVIFSWYMKKNTWIFLQIKLHLWI